MTVKETQPKITPFYLADYLIEPDINSISLNGTRHKMEPKIMQVLLCLSERPKEVISKDYLLNTVWADTMVVDMVLTRAISELRSVFKDKPKQPKFIETIPKKGYRLIANIEPIGELPKAKKSIQPLSSNKKLAYLVPILLLIGIAVVLFSFFNSSKSATPKSNTFSTQNLTTLKGWEYHPALSPDGQKLAFIHKSQDSPFSNLMVQSLQTQKQISLSRKKGQFLKPTWSPDGQRIAVFGYMDNVSAIYLIPATGGEMVQVTSASSNFVGLSWSSDGQQLAFVKKDSVSNQDRIYLYQLENKTIHPLGQYESTALAEADPKFNPDGKQIAFIRTIAEGNQDIYLFDVEKQQLKRLTQLQKNVFGFDWQDKQTLIFSSNIEERPKVFQLNIKTDLPIQASQLQALAPTISLQNPINHPSGFISEKWQSDTDLAFFDLTTNQFSPANNLSSTQWELHPAFSKDGKQIAYTSNKSGAYEIWISDIDGQNVQQLTHLQKGFPAKPQWSPNGQQIVFESNHEGKHQLYLLDLKLGGTSSALTSRNTNHINPIFSKDGQQIYCSIQRDNQWNIWQINLINQHKKQVTFEGGYLAKSDEQNHWLYFVKPNQNGLWRKSLNDLGIKPSLLIEALNWADWGSWVVQETGIYYVKRKKNGEAAIQFYNFTNNTNQEVFTTPKNIPYYDPSLAISAINQQLIIGQTISYDSDLILTKITN